MLKRRTKHGPIGLDIGACGIKMLQFYEEGTEPNILAAAHYPSAPTADDPEQRSTAIGHAVADALRRHPFRGRETVVALAFGEFQMKNIRLPRMPAEELASAIQFEAQDRFGVDEDGAQIRHINAGEVRHGNELKEEIIVFAAPDDLLQARIKMIEGFKLRPVAIDIAPCAVARGFFRFLRRTEDAQAVNVFLDLGWRGTSIVLTRGTELSFLKTIDVGGRCFNEAVAQAMSISQEEAAELRARIIQESCRRRSRDESSVPRDIHAAVSDAVRPHVERISREVQLCLRYFAVTFRGQRPASLTLVGGEAHEPSLIRTIGEQIDVPCTIGNPLRGIRSAGPVGARDQRAFQPAWAVACGLALRGSRWLQLPESRGAGTAGRQAVGAAG